MKSLIKIGLAGGALAIALCVLPPQADAFWGHRRVTTNYSIPSVPGYTVTQRVVVGRPLWAPAPVVVGYAPAPVVVGYAPAPAVVYRAAPAAYLAPTAAYYPPTTAYYAPSTAYYAPSTTYYAPSTAYYPPTTSYYAPAGVTTYYAPSPVIVGAPFIVP